MNILFNTKKKKVNSSYIYIFLLFVFFFCVSSVGAQSARHKNITLRVQNEPIERVFNKISKQTNFKFFYDQVIVNKIPNVTFNFKNATIQNVLKEITAQTNLYFNQVNNTISVTLLPKAKEDASLKYSHSSRLRKIFGTIYDSNNEPIIGANVIVKGTKYGSITDMNGKFSFDGPEDGMLQVSYIGYKGQQIPISGKQYFTVTLKENTKVLDEVVVVGYGVQKKRDVTGAISSISNKDLATQSENNIQNLLQGRLYGVMVTTSGVAGEAPAIRIRGVGTLNDNSPLYVIDGFPTKSEVASQLDPSSIESVQVLKDASSASIYGSRASNGVILITTKQGSTGKTSCEVKVNEGIQFPTNLPEMLNSQQYGEVLWKAMSNAGLTPHHAQYGSSTNPIIPDYILPSGASENQVDFSQYNTDENQFMKANKKGTDWANEVYHPAKQTTIDLNAQGGSEGAKFFLDMNYQTQDALVKWANYNRFSIRSNSSFNILKNTTLGANMDVVYSKYKGGTSDASAVFMAPLIPVRDVMDNWAGTKADGLGDSTNPVADLYGQRNNYNSHLNFLENLFLNINLLKYFTFRTTAGANIENYESKSFSPKTYWNKGDKNTLQNSLSTSRAKTTEIVWDNTLTFNRTFSNIHKLTVLIGSEAISSKYNYLSASRDGFIIENKDYRYLDAGETNKDNSENGSEYALFSLFSRINYQYRDTYYLSAILRRDGSSRFSEDNRYGYFPGLSAAWRISEEPFMKNQKIFSDLKLRASWGKTGNQEIGNYAFASTYGENISTSSYPVAGDVNNVTQGISKETIGNSDIKWESTTQTNIGFDANFFDNRLNMIFDYYRKYTTNILQQVTYPETAGVSTAPYENIGEMQNNGYELSLNYKNPQDREFKYELGIVLSGYKNRVKRLASNQFISGTYTRTEVGHPISSFYGYIIDGIFQTQEEVDHYATQTDKAIGRWKFRDVNKDGVIDDKDRTYIGNPHPDFEYSLSGRFYYKKFDFSIFIQGTYGNDICFASKCGQTSTDFWADYTNKSTRILDTWSEDNRKAKLPQINILNPNDEASKITSYLIENGSYLRIKSLELGYTFSRTFLSKLNINSCRFYINAENLLTWTKYNNLDPEVKNSNDLSIGVDNVNKMPLGRIFSIGFNLKF